MDGQSEHDIGSGDQQIELIQSGSDKCVEFFELVGDGWKSMLY